MPGEFRLFLIKTHEIPGEFRLFLIKTHEMPGEFRLFLIKTHEMPGEFRLFLIKTRKMPGEFRLFLIKTHEIPGGRLFFDKNARDMGVTRGCWTVGIGLFTDAEVFEYIAKHFVGCDLATSYFG